MGKILAPFCLCALAIFGIFPASGAEDLLDLPVVVPAPPLRTLQAKRIATVVGVHPFTVPGQDAVYFFRGSSLFRLDVAGGRAGRTRRVIDDRKLIKDGGLLDLYLDSDAVTPFEMGGRPFVVLHVRPTALLVDLDRGRVLPIRARSESADPVLLQIRHMVLGGATSVLCYAEVASGPTRGQEVWTLLDLDTGNATVVPFLDSVFRLTADGQVAFDDEHAFEIETGRRLAPPDKRRVPYFELDGDQPLLISALPLRIIDWANEERSAGVQQAGRVTFPILFPRDARKPIRAKTGDGFAAYLIEAGGDEHLFVSEMWPDAPARRVAHLDSGHTPFALVSGGHCLFEADPSEKVFVYSLARHAVFDPFEATASLIAAVNHPRHLLSVGVRTVSAGLGTAPAGTWGAAQVHRRVRWRCEECWPSGSDLSWPVLPLTILISPRGQRFAVDYPKTTQAHGAAMLFNSGALVLPATFQRPWRPWDRRKWPPIPGLVLFQVALPDESPLPRPTPAPPAAPQPPAVEHLFESGRYLRQAVPPGLDGHWLGLVEVFEKYDDLRFADGPGLCFVIDEPDRHELADCTVKTSRLDSGVDALGAVAVSTSCSVGGPVDKAWDRFLLRDVPGLVAGPVTMAKRTRSQNPAKSSCTGSPAAQESHWEDLVLGDERCRVEKFALPETSPPITALRLTCGSTTQDLLRTEHGAFVEHALDLDRDGRLDLYVEERPSGPGQGERMRRILFLSSLARPGELVAEAGRFDAKKLANSDFTELPR